MQGDVSKPYSVILKQDKSMKTFKSMPTQTAFFDRYANLIHSLTRFAVVAQIITGMAEIGIIYSLIYPSFADLFPSVAHPLSITGSLLTASILQVGLKLVFPYSVRAILFKRFTGLDLPLSISVFILTIALLAVSVLLSYKGSQDIIDVAIAPPINKSTTATDSIRATAESQANAIFKTDSITIETKYTGKKEAIESELMTQINSIERYSKGKQATSLRAELKTKLAKLQTNKADEIEAKANERKAMIERANDRNDTERQDIKTDNNEAKAKAENRKSKYKNYVGYFTLFCYIFFLIAFILDEIYKKGAGITETPIPHQRHFSPSLIAELGEAWKARIDTNLRALIYAFADKTKASPLPNALDSLYDFKADTLKNIQTIETEQTETKVIKLPTKPLRVAAKANETDEIQDMPETKKRYSIGFKKDSDIDEKTTDASSHTASVYTASVGDKTKICLHCGKSYIYSIHNQKYCTENCRIQAYEQRSGKQLKKQPKKK